MDENGNISYADESALEYENNISLGNISTNTVADDIDVIEEMLRNFSLENKNINDLIKDINIHLIEDELTDFTKVVEELTARVSRIDESIDVIKDTIRLFEEMYGKITTFSIESSELVNMISDTKEKLKSLKVLQVVNYTAKVDAINKKIAKLKAFKELGIDEEVVVLIDSLKYLEKQEFMVTDWKYGKHKNINYDEIKELDNTIDLIQEQLEIEKNSVYVEKLDGLKDELDKRINVIDDLINDNMSLDDISKVKQGLRDIVNLVYNFGTELYLHKDKIIDLEHRGYLQFIREARNKSSILNNKLVANKVYKNIKDELDSQLNDVSKKLDIFLRYVDIHYGNANRDIVEFDREELVVLEREFDYVENKIKSRKEQLIDSQYDRLIRCCVVMEDKFIEAKKKIYDDKMIRKIDLYATSLEEIENGLQELEDKIDSSINKDSMKFISDKISYLEHKIESIESMLNANRDTDSRQYGIAMSSIYGFKERLFKVSSEYEKKKPLRVKIVKSGKKIYQKHNKLILTSAGIIAITLLLRKFLLIPAIMHGNVMIGAVSPAFQGTTSFFNKILGGMIGASMDINGIWHLANGTIINSSVATTSLLKGLVTGIAGFGASLIPILVLSIKELVEEMKIKERIQRLRESINKKEVSEEHIELGIGRKGR